MPREFEYSGRQFIRLMEMVEAEGGVHLDEQCKARKFTFTGDHGEPAMLPYCGNSALFEVPYEVPQEGTNAAVLGKAKVCAVDDAMGLWPRYAEAMR